MPTENHTDIEIKGELHKRTVVFADTRFFKAYKLNDDLYMEFLEYVKSGDIVLCTSTLCLEEWRTQKVKHLNGAVQSTRETLTHFKKINPLTSLVFDNDLQVYLPDKDYISEKSKEMAKQFVRENKIKEYKPHEGHIQPTWDAYFGGKIPFSGEKEKDDIPDAWIFVAAQDALNAHQHLPYKFCISSDGDMNGNLGTIGFQPIKLSDLVTKLREQEEPSPQEVSDHPQSEDTSTSEPSEPPLGELDKILAMAVPEARDVYLRVLGYVHWLEAPDKSSLISTIAGQGFDIDLISSSITMLSQPSLGLVKDTGNHLLPVNVRVCKEAADRILPEILEALERE